MSKKDDSESCSWLNSDREMRQKLVEESSWKNSKTPYRLTWKTERWKN